CWTQDGVNRVFSCTILIGNLADRCIDTESAQDFREELTKVLEPLPETKHRVRFGLEVVDNQRAAVVGSGSTANFSDGRFETMLVASLLGVVVTRHASILLSKRDGGFRSVEAYEGSRQSAVWHLEQLCGLIRQVGFNRKAGILFDAGQIL